MISFMRLKAQHSENEDNGIQSHHFMGSRWGKMETVRHFIFRGSKITADGDYSHEIKRYLLLGRKAMTNLDSIFKKQRHYCADKSPSSQSYGFSSSHVWTWEKAMATHSSVLAWRIPGTGEPGGLLSMRSHGVGHS